MHHFFVQLVCWFRLHFLARVERNLLLCSSYKYSWSTSICCYFVPTIQLHVENINLIDLISECSEQKLQLKEAKTTKSGRKRNRMMRAKMSQFFFVVRLVIRLQYICMPHAHTRIAHAAFGRPIECKNENKNRGRAGCMHAWHIIYQNHLHFELTDTINQGSGSTAVAIISTISIETHHHYWGAWREWTEYKYKNVYHYYWYAFRLPFATVS